MEANGVRGETALHLADLCRHADVIQLLLEANANVEAGADDRHTALHGAAQLGHADVIHLLLEAILWFHLIGQCLQDIMIRVLVLQFSLMDSR